MNDPVLRVLSAREALGDGGYSKSLLLSGAAHFTSFFIVLILTLLTPPRKIINVIDGFAVPLPRGGGMPRASEPAPAEAAPGPRANRRKPRRPRRSS